MATRAGRTSVVMGCYNGAKFLTAQLDSIAAQTVLPHELIVSDDGSTDQTLEIARDFAQRAPFPVQVEVNPQNLGFADNFMHAASLATGDLIAFCDQDDIWRSDKLAMCEAVFDADPGVVLAVHTARLISDDQTVLGDFTQGITATRTRPPLSYRPWDVFFGFSMVFHRSLLTVAETDARCIDYVSGAPRLAHDRWILFLANIVGATCEIALPLADYRQHGGNLYGSGKHTKPFSRQRVMQESDRYVRAGERMRDIVAGLAANNPANGIAYDHARTLAWIDRAVRQQTARNAIYHAGRARGALIWATNFANGTYQSLVDDRFLAKAALKDLRCLMSR